MREKISRMRFYIQFVWLLLSLPLLGQEPGMRNFTTSDGLPSDEVYQSFIDRRGYIWFATNSGVCYYDGSVFKTMDLTDGLLDNTILEIEEDTSGRIWFSGISGNLCYLENGKIYPYKYNDIIQQYKKKAELIGSGELQPIDTNNVKLLTNQATSLHIINNHAEVKRGRGEDTVLITKNKNIHQLYFYHDNEKHISRFIAKFNDSISVTYNRYNTKYSIDIISYHLYQEYEDKIVYMMDKYAIIFYKNGTVEEIQLDYKPIYSIKGIYGGLWVGSISNGLLFYSDEELLKKPKLRILENRRVTSLRYDQNTRGWVTTFSGGIYHVQSLHITNYQYPFNDAVNRVAKLVELDNGYVIGFSQENAIFRFKNNYKSFELIKMPELQNELIYNAKLYNKHVFIATNHHMVVVHQDYFIKTKSNIKPKIYDIINVKDFIIQDSLLWVVTSGGLFYFPDFLKEEHIKRFRIPNFVYHRSNKILPYKPLEQDTIYSYFLYNDLETIYKVRYPKRHPKKAQYSSYLFNDTVSIATVNDIKLNGENIILGSKGMGLILLNNDSLHFINTSHGLISNYITQIELGENNELYLATNRGMNILYFSDSHYSRLDSIKLISIKDGMKSDHINDFLLFRNHALCATNKGISLINIPELISFKDKFPILIKSFKVNNINILKPGAYYYKLNSSDNNLNISFDAIDLHDKDGIKYYYKLLGSNSNEWNEISEQLIVFPEMSAGEYTFLVKAKNSYGYESQNIASLHFSIAKKFYLTWAFRISTIIVFVVVLFLVIRSYYNRKDYFLQSEKLLADYHQQSLTRLLNPHFIANVLNSVSASIIKNRREEAISYLKNIGDLINQVFNSAHRNNISIKQEVNLLQNYLKLEQMRSNSNFSYLIKYDLDIGDIQIPSMMVQLFVENSVLHGFSDKKTRGGLISVIFEKIDDFIVCKITDNGMGRKEASKNKKYESNKPRKHGLDIINQRLELKNIQQQELKYSMIIKDMFSVLSGKPIGTFVELKFPLIKEPETNRLLLKLKRKVKL